MNRLVLLGNGFDLAHGLPTRYEDFMLQYLKDVFKKKHDASGLIYVKREYIYRFDSKSEHAWGKGIDDATNINELLKHLYSNNKIVTYNIKSNFLSGLLNNLDKNNWVDIESEYYRLLKICYRSPNSHKIAQLNKDFETLKSILESYLKKEVEETYYFKPSKEFLNIFLTKKKDIPETSAFSVPNAYPEKTLFLNFNYTTLLEDYLIEPEVIHHLRDHEVNYIHGELESAENPIIFGFGDEMDKSYQEIEELNNNAYFEHIKSFQYLKTSNYQDLIRFLDGSVEGYEIYIIGHSCGLSDRTLLNHVFEHDHCKSIKIFYHNGIKGYTNTVYEISRHFNDKASMRTKIVPFEKSIPTPQVQLEKSI
ncbi:AbiH family protein [Kordia jejudonensis]|uniref:AbiH family protein n=1 Tax=Kordia jejudonensis TaxID=1348245 RepID=UPI0009E4FA74|nr:AbiH family protein [Kordia jejudonensis]